MTGLAAPNGSSSLPRRIGGALHSVVSWVGQSTLNGVAEVGYMAIFFADVCKATVRRPYRYAQFFHQAEFIGFGSLFIVLLTGVFTGAVFTLQTVVALERVGLESMVGSTVMLAVSRELGPVLAALMVTGRVGSAMATELGTMRVTEQIDAIEVMAVNPLQYLVVPRIWAATLMLPALSMLFEAVAFIGSYTVAVGFMGIDEGAYMSRIELYVDGHDFVHGLGKALVFGAVIAVIGCFKGYNARGGARGVGMATTQAVVLGSISVFVLDYVLTAILLAMFPEV